MILNGLYSRMANWILVLVSLLAFLAIGWPLLAIDKEFRRSQDPSVIQLELAYKQEPFTSILKSWTASKGDAAIPAFRRQLWFDNLWAISYAVLFSSIIASVTIRHDQAPSPRILLLFALPLLAGLFDIFPENALYLLLLRNGSGSAQLDHLPALPILVASIAATIKFALLALAFSALLLILIVKINRSFRQSLTTPTRTP
jgi:hypothetical protein